MRKQVIMASQLKFLQQRIWDLEHTNPIELIDQKTLAYRQMLMTEDMVQCVNRIGWAGINSNLKPNEIESMLYQYHTLMLLEKHETGEILFLKFMEQGQLNEYGQMQELRAIDFSGKTYDKEYTVLQRGMSAEDLKGKDVGVLIRDYSISAQATIGTPRQIINEFSTIDDEVATYRQMRTNILLSLKKALVLCDTEEQRRVIMKQAEELFDETKPLVAISKNGKKGKQSALDGVVEMFNTQATFDTQNYCQTIDFYNKKRRQFNGIASPDTFEKKERMITAEADNSNLNADNVLADALRCRKNAVELFTEYAKFEENKHIIVDYAPLLKARMQAETQPQDNGGDDYDDE